MNENKNENLEIENTQDTPVGEEIDPIVIEEDTHPQTFVSEYTEVPRKKRKFTINLVLLVLLLLAIVLLFTSMYAYKNREVIRENAKPTIEPILDSSSSEPVPTALPNELISTSSMTVLVDRTHGLQVDYVPENLATPYLLSTTNVIEVNEEAGNQAKQMMADAMGQGFNLYVTSGYVSYSQQDTIYHDLVDLVGEEIANNQAAKPGYSEHQTGLALDFTDDPTITNQTVDFANTGSGQWLYEHAHEYGFILRYPKGKESITGYAFQPWHYRYVGVDTANAIYAVSPDETFEEYFNIQ